MEEIIIFENDKIIVRAIETQNGLTIRQHIKIDDKEVKPNGYVLGHNYLYIRYK